MLNQRLSAAKKIAGSLHAAELAIDEAIARASELSAAIPAARGEANLSALVGHEATENVADALRVLAKARRHMVTAHGNLDEAKDQIGLRTRGFGGGMTKPIPPTGRHLHAVDARSEAAA